MKDYIYIYIHSYIHIYNIRYVQFVIAIAVRVPARCTVVTKNAGRKVSLASGATRDATTL